MRIEIQNQRLRDVVDLSLAGLPRYALDLIGRNVNVVTDDPDQFKGVERGTEAFTMGLPDGRFNIVFSADVIQRHGPGFGLACALHEFAHAALEHPRPGNIEAQGREALEAEAWRLTRKWIDHSSRVVEAAARRQRFDSAIERFWADARWTEQTTITMGLGR